MSARARDRTGLDARPAGVPLAYRGVWRRTLLETPDARDADSDVLWLQTAHWHADLRIPAQRPDFSGVQSLAACSDSQLAWLATQQGFCGLTLVDGDTCTWHRQLDVQPPNGRDVGRMGFEDAHLVETGVLAPYRELWVRDPAGTGSTAALELVTDGEAAPARPTWLLLAGACFAFVRNRICMQPASRHASPAALRAWLDIEISVGRRDGETPWRIERSTLPFREGCLAVHPDGLTRCGYASAIEGDGVRRWRILDSDADTPF